MISGMRASNMKSFVYDVRVRRGALNPISFSVRARAAGTETDLRLLGITGHGGHSIEPQ